MFTSVSEVLYASIIRAMRKMMEAAISFETSVNFSRLHAATTQKTVVLRTP
jgi:hypothetical protein